MGPLEYEVQYWNTLLFGGLETWDILEVEEREGRTIVVHLFKVPLTC